KTAADGCAASVGGAARCEAGRQFAAEEGGSTADAPRACCGGHSGAEGSAEAGPVPFSAAVERAGKTSGQLCGGLSEAGRFAGQTANCGIGARANRATG